MEKATTDQRLTQMLYFSKIFSYLSIRNTYKTHKNDVTFLTSQMILLVWLSFVKISLNDSIEFYFNKFVQNVAILIGFMQSQTTTNISVLFCFELKREKKKTFQQYCNAFVCAKLILLDFHRSLIWGKMWLIS